MHRWSIRILFFALEALLIFAAGVLWLGVADGSRPSLAAVLDVLQDPGLVAIPAGWTLILVAAQVVLLLPVRKPAAEQEARMSVRASLVTAALAAAALIAGGAVAAVELVTQWEDISDRPTPWLGLLAILLGAWAVATPALYAFSRGRRHEAALSRIAAGLFIGTIIEVLLIIPIDVMVRRRTDCYCATGTFLGLTAVGSVGLFSFGPAVLLPLVSRRRRRWWSGHCDVCGYDMSGLRDAERCPECGAGWKAVGPPGDA